MQKSDFSPQQSTHWYSCKSWRQASERKHSSIGYTNLLWHAKPAVPTNTNEQTFVLVVPSLLYPFFSSILAIVKYTVMLIKPHWIKQCDLPESMHKTYKKEQDEKKSAFPASGIFSRPLIPTWWGTPAFKFSYVTAWNTS